MIFGKRFLLEYIQNGSCQFFLVECIDQSLFVHTGTTAYIHEHGMRRQGSKDTCVHQFLSSMCVWKDGDQIIQPACKLKQMIPMKIPVYMCTFFTLSRIPMYVHLEKLRHPRNFRSNRSHAKQADGFAI